jgi:acetyltransferase-like isoleucine patch superfamily enzyme
MTIRGVFLKISRSVKLKIVKLQGKFIHIGENVIIDYKTKIITNNNKLLIGNNVYLRSIKDGYQAAMPFPTTILLDIPGAIVKIGDNSRLNGVYIHAQKNIEIGYNCVIASGVQIIDTNGHILLSLNRTEGRDLPEKIKIGNNVWIGINAIILKGTEIGDNSVVSAGSIVKGVFPNNSLIVGNPASIAKKINI